MNQPNTNISKFDVLRGISIILVFLYHSFISIGVLGKLPTSFPRGEYFINFGALGLKQWFVLFSPLFYGSGGVQIFLLISGFLIHYSFLKSKEENLNIKGFFSRRVWRIYPPYLLALFFFVFCVNGGTFSWNFQKTKYLFSHLSMTHNLWDEHFFQINSSFWSLALECQLYLVYPLVIIFRKKYGIKNIFWFSFFIFVMAVNYEIFYLNNSIAWSLGLPKSWVIWILGAYLAESYINQTPIFKAVNKFWLAVIFILFILLLWSNIFEYFFHIAAAFLGAILIEKYLYSPKTQFNFLEKALVPVGLCSYSMYLFHQPLLEPLYKLISFMGLSNRNGVFSVFDMAIVFGILFCLSYTLYLFVELPSIAFGKEKKSMK